MAKFHDMDWLVANLQRLQVSDIRQTRRNNRDELGSLQDLLAQLFFKSAIAAALNAHPELQFSVTPSMTDRLWAYFVANQDADTGYRGPTYVLDRAARAGAGPVVHLPHRPFPQGQHRQSRRAWRRRR